MANRLPYAGWAAMQIRSYDFGDAQEARAKYFKNSGKLHYYKYYARYCQENGYEPDEAPNGYVHEVQSQTGTYLALVGAGIMATLGYFLLGVIGGGTGRASKD